VVLTGGGGLVEAGGEVIEDGRYMAVDWKRLRGY